MCEGLSCFFSLEMTGTHQGRLQKPKSQNTSAKSGEGVPLPTFLAHFFHGRGTPLTDGFRDSFFEAFSSLQIRICAGTALVQMTTSSTTPIQAPTQAPQLIMNPTILATMIGR